MNLLLLAGFLAAEEFSLVSWNVQAFGRVKAERLALCEQAYAAVVSTDVWVLAVQEIANEKGSALFMSRLPEGPWAPSFEDTPDPMDNALYFRGAASAPRRGFLFADPETGRPDRSKLLHPARWAHVRAGDFDFTLVSVHLTYARGDARRTKVELRALLEWAAAYLAEPANDPDVVIAGDFNLSAEELEELAAPLKLRVLVTEPTTKGRRSYDHFLVSEDVAEELVAAGRSPAEVPPVSDHFPIVARFRSKGPGVAPDFKLALSRP